MSFLSIAWHTILVYAWIMVIAYFIILPFSACSISDLINNRKELLNLQCMAEIYSYMLSNPSSYRVLIFIVVLIAVTVVPLIIPFFSANKQSNAPTNLQQSAGRRRH